MIAALLSWFARDFTGALAKAYEAKLNAQNDAQRIAADIQIKAIEAKIAEDAQRGAVVKEGMQHRAFWIPWLIAAVPTSAWFGWGMLDSLSNGYLPDVAALPPQLKQYADIVFSNIFYTGAGMAGFQAVASAIRRK